MIEFSPGNDATDPSEWLMGEGGKYILPEIPVLTGVVDVDSIEADVEALCDDTDIRIQTVEMTQKQRLGLIVGSVLRKHTMVAIQEYRDTYPGQKQIIFPIPGSADATLTNYYRRVGDDLTSSDHTRRCRAITYRDRLVKLARARSDIFPEVTMVDQLESRWSVAGYIAARSSMRDLTATYGTRIERVEKVRQQQIRNHEIAYNLLDQRAIKPPRNEYRL